MNTITIILGLVAFSSVDSNLITDTLGSAVTWNFYSSGLFFQNAGKGVRKSVELDCDFESNCCWKNAYPDFDQLEFFKATGEPSDQLLKSHFDTKFAPVGSYLVIGAGGASMDSREAQFVSCPIVCAASPVEVKLRTWIKGTGMVQVCQQQAFVTSGGASAPLTSCKDVGQTTNAEHPVSVTLPPGNGFQIVIVAYGLKQGFFLVLDDIYVNYTPCPKNAVLYNKKSTTTTAANMTSTIASASSVSSMGSTTKKHVCDVECDVEGASAGSRRRRKRELDASGCHIENLAAKPGQTPVEPDNPIYGVNNNFELASGTYGNRATGIRQSGQGSFYMAAELTKLGDKAAFITQEVDLNEQIVVRALVYAATKGLTLFGCCNDLSNCPLETPDDPGRDALNWRNESFICPAGTKKFVFGCRLKINNKGACGVDNIKMYKAEDGLAPEQATKPAC